MHAMNPPTLQSQPESRSSRRSRPPAVGEELSKKPKKVNSEVRKQQNRIASRNYREKRKQKLQYLQRLIKDGPNDDETSELSPSPQPAQLRSLSSEYEDTRPTSSPYSMPTTSAYSLSPSGSVALDPNYTPSTTPFDGHFAMNAPEYSPFESAWPASPYIPQTSSGATWSMPTWAPHMEFTSRMVSYPDPYQYTAPTGPPVFAQEHSTYQSQRGAGFGDNFHSQGHLDHYYNAPSQASATTSVSVPAPTSYALGYYPSPH